MCMWVSTNARANQILDGIVQCRRFIDCMEQFVRNYVNRQLKLGVRAPCCVHSHSRINAFWDIAHAIRKLMWINKGNKWNKSQCLTFYRVTVCYFFSPPSIHPCIVHVTNNWAGDIVSFYRSAVAVIHFVCFTIIIILMSQCWFLSGLGVPIRFAVTHDIFGWI